MARSIRDAIMMELVRRKISAYALANLIGKPYTTVHRQLKTGRFSVESADRMMKALGLNVCRA